MIRLIQVSETFLKQVGAVIRLRKEDGLSNCSSLVYSAAMLKFLVIQSCQIILQH